MPTEYIEDLGTPSGLIATNVTGTASALIANTVTTNANLSGAITSVGNVTSLGSFTSAQLAAAITDETGNSKIVFSDSPQLAGIVNISNLVASTIMSADASKNVVSLSLATYPSLTELSYVKGVTSAVQTQINTKAPIANPTFTGTVGGITAAMVGAPSGSGTSSGTNTGDNSAASLVPAQASQAEKVLSTDGSASYWAIEGVKTGYPSDTVILGRVKPTVFASVNSVLLGVGATIDQTYTNGNNSVCIGYNASSTLDCVAIGANAIASAVNGTGSVAIGKSSTATGECSVAVGLLSYAGRNGTAIGYNARSTTAGGLAIGRDALSSGYASISIGRDAQTSFTQSLCIGFFSAVASQDSVGIGYGINIGSGASSIVIGSQSGKASCSGANNTVVGADSFNGASLTTADSNVIVGKGSGKAFTTGRANIILGVSSATNITTGSNNIFIGNLIGGSVAQDHSICVGYGAVAGDHSVSIGSSVDGAGGTVVGSYSVGIGAKVGGLSTDSESVRIGRLSSTPGGGFSGNIAGGSRSVCIGAYTSGALQATSYQNNDDCVYLGYAAGSWSMNKTNELFIDNQSRGSYVNQQAKSLMYGTFNATASSQTLAINAALSTPYTLAVTGVATFTAAPVVSSVTASQILASSATKEVVSLSTATYPSLTELAYVKGVTSAIQTQLNAAALPSQTSQADKVLVTDGSTSSWQYAGLGSGGFGATQIFLGQAKPTSASGADVTIIGRTSGPSITTAPNMILIGSSVLPTGTGGYGGIISLGTSGNSLTGSTTGSNIAIGFGGSFGDANAQYSTLIGGSICGNSSTVVGFLGRADGPYSVAIGVTSSTGTSGVAIGCESDSYGQNETIVIGRRASNRNTQGIVIGAFAGAVWQNGVGPQNTIVGAYAGGLQSGVGATKNVFLGYYAGGRNTNQGNEFFVDNQDRTTYANQQTKSLLYGTFNATASSQTLAINADLKMLTYTESVIASGVVGATQTISILSGTVQTATLTASALTTFTMPTATAGKSFTLYLKQAAATGLGTATFTGVKWATAGAPVITATAGLMDILSFVADGTNWYGSYQQGYTP